MVAIPKCGVQIGKDYCVALNDLNSYPTPTNTGVPKPQSGDWHQSAACQQLDHTNK